MSKKGYKKLLRKQRTLHNEALSKHYETLTVEERKAARTQLTIRQDGCCKICGQSEKDLNRKLSIDHCHATGHIRGLLCHRCNWLLGYAKDNIYILQSAIDYLRAEAERTFV